jgi:hypothetical protein
MRYDRLAEVLGCQSYHVAKHEDIRPALEKAAQVVASGTTPRERGHGLASLSAWAEVDQYVT